MNIDPMLTDQAILHEIGQRLNRRRVELNLTQAQLAEQAGIGKRTVERIEAGESTQLSTLVRIVRVLGLINALDAAIPASGPRPLDLLKLKGRERQRASSKNNQQPVDESWSWGDES
ncbi:MAG: transcriptional regulator [Desulfuromonadaceae bacterium GWC2_58_13]|nr:MAG: transcriptional regulator [Desulfuromonadaceae bacterium GWC2_58_13]